MLDVTEQLRRYADTVAETVDPVPFTAVDAITTQPSRDHGRRWPVLAAAAAVVLAILAGIGWLAVRSEDDPSPADDPTPSTNEVRPGVTMLDPGPLEPRADAAVVWTGKEMVVWGGDIEAANQGRPGEERSFADGAAYDPATNQWRLMSDSPLPDTMDGVTAVNTDAGVVIARGNKVARWSPDTDSWRELDDAPDSVTEGTTPDLIAVPAGEVDQKPLVFSIAANGFLDPDAGTWTPMPLPPVELTNPVGAWNGRRLIVVGGQGNGTTGALAYDPMTFTWDELPPPPGLNPNAIAVTRVGDRLVFTDYEMFSIALEDRADGGSWEAVPPVPARFMEHSPTLTAAGDALVATESLAIAIRVGDSAWVPVPYDELDFWSRAVVTTGDDLLVFGLTRDGNQRLARVDPARIAISDRALQVGVARVALPKGTTVGGSGYQDAGTTATVRVDLLTPTGGCSVTSTYVSATSPVRGWVQEVGTGAWATNATTTDEVRISCDDPATATRLKDETTFRS